MKKNRLLFLVFITVLFASVIYMSLLDHFQINVSEAGAVEELFSDAKVKEKLDPVKERTIIRQRYVNINLGLLVKADGSPRLDNNLIKFQLNLFDDTVLSAVIDKTESVQAGSLSYIGYITGVEQSSIILSVYDGIMSGNISLPGGVFYQVRYVGEGVHAVYQIDQSAFPPEAPPIPVSDTHKDSSQNSIPVKGDSGATIDVMVLYTPATRSAAGGEAAMQSLISLAVSETNTGYSQSGVTQQIRLVHSKEVVYTELGDALSDWTTDLNRLTSGTDGYMDEIHALRD